MGIFQLSILSSLIISGVSSSKGDYDPVLGAARQDSTTGIQREDSGKGSLFDYLPSIQEGCWAHHFMRV
jgi:hypothetical protein